MQELKFSQSEAVTIHSLGESTPGEFRGRICGISADWGDNPATSWIVELIDPVKVRSEFTHACFPQACLRKGWS